jgi:hypothetical protein
VCLGIGPSRIFGPKREKVVENWRNMYNEEVHNVYSSPIIIKVLRIIANMKGRIM